MLRRYLFLGLTLMLATVLVYLVIQSRREEQRAAKARSTGVVLQSPLSETRAIAPSDLEVDGCRIRLTPAGEKYNAGADIEIRNAGPTNYHNLMLRITLLDQSNAAIQSRQLQLREPVVPGATFSAALIPLDDVPSATAGCRAEVVYADIGPAGETAAAK